MKTLHPLDNLTFSPKGPQAEPLHADRAGRAILFTLQPGQTIPDHNAPSSPFYVVVLQGRGVFSGQEGVAQTCGPNTLLLFDPAETHSIRALDENLVFVGFLHGVPSAREK